VIDQRYEKGRESLTKSLPTTEEDDDDDDEII
jgi:hypothetical protein